MLMSRRIRDATEGDKKRCSINPSFESSLWIKNHFYHISFSLKLDACLDTSRVTVRCPNRNRGVYSLGLARSLRPRQSPSVPSARQDGGHHWTFTERNWTTRRDLNAFAGTLLARVLQTRLQFAGSGSWGERGGRVF